MPQTYGDEIHYTTLHNKIVFNTYPVSTLSPRQKWFVLLIGKHADGDIKAFAPKCGVDRTTLSLFVNGHKEPSDKHVVRVANRLNVQPPPEVLEYNGLNKQPEVPPPIKETVTIDRDQFNDLLDQVKLQTRLLNMLVSKLDQ